MGEMPTSFFVAEIEIIPVQSGTRQGFAQELIFLPSSDCVRWPVGDPL